MTATDDEQRLGPTDDHQWAEGVPVAELGREDAERSDRDARHEGETESGGPAPLVVGHARDQDDGEHREDDPEQDERLRQPLEDDPGRDRDQRRDDPGDGGDDAHPPDGEAAIQSGDPDPADEPGEDAPDEVGRRRGGLRTDDGKDERERHPDQLREQDDAEQRGPTGQQPSTEVAPAPGERRDQAEDDGRGLGRGELVQGRGPGPATSAGGGAAAPGAATPAGAGAPWPLVGSASAGEAPLSTLVGPSRTTTESAASS